MNRHGSELIELIVLRRKVIRDGNEAEPELACSHHTHHLVQLAGKQITITRVPGISPLSRGQRSDANQIGGYLPSQLVTA